MSELDAMLAEPADAAAALPPLVRYYKGRLDAGDRVEVEVHRPDGPSRTALVVHRWEGEREQEPKQIAWDDGVNAGLIELGVRAVDLRQEGERFALGIQAALRRVERRYGDGYLNAVLLELLGDSELAKGDELAAVLKHVHANQPNRGGSYADCRAAIAAGISGRAVELRERLKYGRDEVKAVMTTALAVDLGERFSVSMRRKLGFL